MEQQINLVINSTAMTSQEKYKRRHEKCCAIKISHSRTVSAVS